MNLPVNQACLRNQQPILNVLEQYFVEKGLVFELGCGTAQHAVHFTTELDSHTAKERNHATSKN